ncbi:NACHT, LRR and PYD domains-containing protein 3-like [Chanos chanos]|uniref:NACHT, LRR and PYD domains-containing protein 3-like n=1 Tax=Chanos chanos TaxID=29144 RepID=A0A6J2VBS8_CHACN|nr:NACHT, LRR and PYD domains-containing protein 3-like [Chanos chanos]
MQTLREKKTSLIKILSADIGFVLQHVVERTLITYHDYRKLNVPSHSSEQICINLLDTLINRGEETCQRFIEMLSQTDMLDTFPGLRQILQDARFVDEHRAELIQRVTMVMPLADSLLSLGMLHEETYSQISAARTRQEKMRALLTALRSGGDRVKSAFYSVLRDVEPHLLQELGKRIKEPLLMYKEVIRFEYAYMTEYDSLPGEHVLLTDHYSELLIIQRHRGQSERKEDILSKGKKLFSKKESEKHSIIGLEEFFNPDDHGVVPKAVILQGSSGHGKSLTAQRIMLDWASGKLYTDNFDFIFHLKCKEINQISWEKSLVELLRYSQSLTPAQISQILQHSPERVLFLIDGFNELELSQDSVFNWSLPTDVQTPASPESTLKALLSGCLLPESFLLVTTRSTATDTLSKLLKKQPQRFTEIMGFSERGVEDYFQSFFKDDQLLQTQAYEHVKANETLFTACFIPVICWIICTVFRERHKDSMEITNVLDTTTSIYVDCMSTLLKYHYQGLSQSVPGLLRSLGQLAKRGMLEQQALFDKKRVSETIPDPANIPFLCKFDFRRKIHQETVFSFIHFSFQEFFTALYYALLTDNEMKREVKRLFRNLEDIRNDFNLDDADERKSKLHLLPVIRFLFGLVNSELSGCLMETYNLSVSPTIQAQLKEWILKVIKERHERLHLRGHANLFVLCCLYEFHEEEFLRVAMDGWEYIDLSDLPLSRMDYLVVHYCLQFCSNSTYVKFTHSATTAEEVKPLQPEVNSFEKFRLMAEGLSHEDSGDLSLTPVDGDNLTKLRENSVLSDQDVQQTLNTLNKQDSWARVLTVKAITIDTALMLVDFFQKGEINKEIRTMAKITEEAVVSLSSSSVGKVPLWLILCLITRVFTKEQCQYECLKNSWEQVQMIVGEPHQKGHLPSQHMQQSDGVDSRNFWWCHGGRLT